MQREGNPVAGEPVAIVTAAGSGMGAACARRLAKDGYRVAVLSLSGKAKRSRRSLAALG